MLRNTSRLLLSLQDSKIAPSHVIVRWRRKPRWLPVAPSKVFRIPQRPEKDPVEHREIIRLHNNYRTMMKSIRDMMVAEVKKAKELAAAAGSGSEIEEIEHAKCLQINDEWNKSIIPIREKRIAEQDKKRAERALRGLAYHEAKVAAQKAQFENTILEEKKNAGTYITKENLDTAIEHALDNIVDYNYCIDLEGNIFYGRNTKPGKVDVNAVQPET